MDRNDYTVYMARMEDIGQQLLDLVAEMRADPPAGWSPPSLGAAEAAFGVPIIREPEKVSPEQIKRAVWANPEQRPAVVNALLAAGVPVEIVARGVS